MPEREHLSENNFVGKEFGNYRITAEINSGAYGSVYKAEHLHLSGRVVAIKLLHLYMGSAKDREQFIQEAQFLAMLEHPHILPVLDFGFRDGQPYLIAGYAAGGSLRELLVQQALLPLEKVVTILTQVGQALQYAHSRNIIHRDLKPENILFNAQGEVLLADFGIATMLSTASVQHLTTVGGTPSYMAPEQFQGIISREGDQYALGCIAYELVTGRRPFTAPDFLSMAFKHLTEPPVPPSQVNQYLPLPIEKTILKALAKQRADRYPDLAAFLAALSKAFRQATILSPSSSLSLFQAGPPPAMRAAIPPIERAEAWSRERWMQEGKMYLEQKRYKEALAAYEQAIRFDPDDAQTHRRRGVALYSLKRYEEALAASEQAIRLDPDDALAHHNKGVALADLRRYEEALAAYEQAIRLDPDNAFRYRSKGMVLANLRRYEEALAAYGQAIRLDPNNASVHTNKGATLVNLRRYEEALGAFEQAIRLDPNNAIAHYNKGYALNNLQCYEEALAALEQAIRLNPNYVDAHSNRGFALKALGRNAEAKAAYTRATALGG